MINLHVKPMSVGTVYLYNDSIHITRVNQEAGNVCHTFSLTISIFSTSSPRPLITAAVSTSLFIIVLFPFRHASRQKASMERKEKKRADRMKEELTDQEPTDLAN